MYARGLVLNLIEALYGELDQVSEEAMLPTCVIFHRSSDTDRMSVVIQHDPDDDVTEELRDQIVSVYFAD